MFLHVDIVKNDWMAGKQVRLGVLVLDGEHLVLHSDVPGLEERVLNPFEDPMTGDVVYPEKEPSRFIFSLHKVMGGSSWFATPPYTDATESAFHSSDELAFVTS